MAGCSTPNKALELKPDLAIARFLASNITFFYDRKLKKGLELASAAYEAAPQNEDIIVMYSIMLGLNNLKDSALQILRKYVERNPVSATSYQAIGNIFTMKRVLDSVFVPCQKALELDPDMIRAKYIMAEAYFGLKKYDLSRQQWEELYQLAPAPLFLEGLIRSIYYSGDKKKADNLFHTLLQVSENMYSPYVLAKAYATLGNKEEAIRYLEEAWINKDIELVAIRVDFPFDSLRNDPRFIAIVNRFKFIN